MAKETKKTVHRSSVSGEFVTKRYADTHKRTTERERVRVRPPKSSGKKGK